MKIGKLKAELLEKYIFNNLSSNREEVIIKGGTGLDNAVLDFGGDLIVASTDPITGASKNIGSLAINVSVNDVSCQCADPVGVLMTVLIPPSATIDDLKEIIDDANSTANKLNVDIVGGHTEITDAVNKILISTTVLGRVNKKIRPDIKSIKPGDVIAVSKYIGIEGTSIIAHDKSNIKEVLNEEELKLAISLSDEISVLKESRLASKYGVKHMHDITEGGLYGALWETGVAIDYGLATYYDNIPVLDVTKKVSEFYAIDPMRLISSGSMLMIFEKDKFTEFKKAAKNEGIKVTKIGEVIKENKTVVVFNDKTLALSEPSSDELYKIID
ncbi:hydrogenase maturation protein [Peptoniphilus sp. AGMB00490]|uniref:Hydrogenase maturation protein n=2 Tax=Peptoniphilus TaxID=162289 RepID=A0ACD6AYU0_9FIRM|nr:MULTISPECIES: AIR synthase family protein [Peptoniphilus]NMW84263.1 hydrogenase maturation protein [Peptoniphilus faecalis]OLR64300.1 hydrogenase maturation protein [Peptoniphilus porci]